MIKRIDIVPDDTMLSKNFRDRLATHVGGSHKPFLSYIGTDLLMHDMGYLSQVGHATQSIRDANGIVKPGYETYVQKIRTPPLKGLRFNNYVTDSHKNTKNPATRPATSCCTTGAPAMRSRPRSCTTDRRSRSCRSSKG